MTEKFISVPISFTGYTTDEKDVIVGVSIASIGEAAGHRLVFDDKSLVQLQQLGSSKQTGIKSRFTHPDWFNDGLGKYLGRIKNFHINGDKLTGDLHISPTAHITPAGDLAGYVLQLAQEDPSALGVCVVVDLDRVWVTTDGSEVPASGGRPSNAPGKYPVARIKELYAADLVDEPALNPGGLFSQVEDDLEFHMSEEERQPNPKEGELQNMEEELINDRFSKLEANIERISAAVENNTIQIGNQPPRGQQVSLGAPALDQFQGYFDWLFGAPGAKLPLPELRRVDALYRAVTGDVEMRGVFDPSRIAFAAASTTTLADLAVNAMNKVVLDLYTNLTPYRWYEMITAVQASDGTLQDMQWLQFGGVAVLPVVAEGAAYTELSVVDTKETSAFTSTAGMFGITDKMIRNSRIDEMLAIPRALTISAIRTRSAAIAAIFTQAAGLGPTLAQDSKALFVADNSHGNYATTSFSIAAWAAARLEAAKQAELGSANAIFGPSIAWCQSTCTNSPDRLRLWFRPRWISRHSQQRYPHLQSTGQVTHAHPHRSARMD